MNIDIKKLTYIEKLNLIGEIWDSMDNPNDLPLTDEQKKILDKHLEEFEKNPITHDWEDVKIILRQIVK